MRGFAPGAADISPHQPLEATPSGQPYADKFSLDKPLTVGLASLRPSSEAL